MKKNWTLLIFSFFAISAMGQVSFQPVMPAGGLVQKNQLWNLVIINSSAQPYTAVIDLVLTDRRTGVEILTATTGQFDISRGTKQLNASTLQPIQYNYLGGWVDTRIQGMLPIGLYNACYRLSQLATNKTITIAEECTQFDVEPLSPPMLIFPADSSVLDKDPQQFSWIPPTPASLFSNLHYEIIVTEILNGQRAPEAIQNNLPFFNRGSIYETNMPYTASAVSFDYNKWYAWQVIAKDNSSYVSKSEVWVFKLQDNVQVSTTGVSPYIKLERRAVEVTIVKEGVLRMEYFNYLADTTVQVWIYDEATKNDERKTNPIQLKVKPGQNYLQYDLGRRIKTGSATIYEAVLINSKGERFFMKFKNVK